MRQFDYNKLMSQTHCHICRRELSEDKCLDHCHITGKIRGYACNSCNLHFKYQNHIPVVFHNLSNFDLHIVLSGLENVTDEITCIPSTMEKYISFSIGNLRFLDSYRFLSSSLGTLVSNLASRGDDDFHFTHLYTPSDKFHLMLQKQIYPYSYMDCHEKFLEKTLPAKEYFYNDLKKAHITDEEYLHAQKVWNSFGLTSMGQYHDLYLKYDTLLLCDVFENFRNLCMNSFNLDPSHYYSLPGFSWDACLRFTEIELELITDIDQYLFFEGGIRGGISVVSNRFSEANNKYLSDFDSDKPSKFILALDVNSLYGLSMCSPLPIGNFKWLNDEEISTLNIQDITDDSMIEFIFEVDLLYPHYIHDFTSDYPLAPEKIKIQQELLSPYSRFLVEKLNINISNEEKLTPNLFHKKSYIVHYRNLKLYTELGMEIVKIHRVLSFTQIPWMKPYINFNTEKRKAATSPFEQDFWKLIINSIFGKSIESVRKRINVQLVTCPNRMIKLASKPSFESFRIFNKNLAAVHMKKSNIKLNKPIYLGMCILEISKCVMYEFHYYKMKKAFADNLKLLYTDTDSFLYEICTEDLYLDLQRFGITPFLDTSSYNTTHPLHNNNNHKCLGKWKDETGGIPIKAFTGLRSKMYSFYFNDQEKKTGKGIPFSTLHKELTYRNYEQMIHFPHKMYLTSNLIRSEKHELFTVLMNKLALSPFDDKRFILPNGCDTLPHGHYLIPFLCEILKHIWN